MEDLLFTLQSVISATVLNGLVAGGAWRLAAAVAPARAGRPGLSALDRAIVALAVMTAAVLAATLSLGALGVLSRWSVTAFAAVFAAAAFLSTRRAPREPFVGKLVLSALSGLRQDRLLVIAVLPGVVVLTLLMAWAAVRPAYGFDPLNYHLPLMASVLRSGSLDPVHFPPYFETFPYFTMNGDLSALWAMLSTGDASMLPFSNVVHFLLLGLVLYAFVRESLSSRAPAAALVMALLTVPAFFVLLADAYVEIQLWAFMFAALRLIVLSGRNRAHAGLFVLAGIMCGAMVGTKLTGIPMAAVLLAAWLFCTESAGARASAWRVAAFLGMTVVFGGYFYVRNMVTVGSPVYPFPMSIGGLQLFDGDAEHAARVGGTTIRRFLVPLVFSGELFKAIVGTRTPPSSSWGLGVTGPFFILAAFASFIHVFRAARSRARESRSAWLGPVFLGASLLAIVVYLHLPWCAPYLYGNVRFVYPAVPFAALAFVSIPGVAAVRRWFVVGVCLVLQLLSFLFATVPTTTGAVVTALVVVVAVGIVSWKSNRPWFVRMAPWLPAVVAFVAVLAALMLRIPSVHAYGQPGIVSGPALWASERAECVAELDRVLDRGPFAVTMARGAPHAWFLFPLLGERFQRQPVYVDISRQGAAGALKSADSLPGFPGADRDFWISGMRASGARVLVVLNDPEDVEIGRTPVELEWVGQMPETFFTVFSGKYCSIFSFEREDAAAGE